MFFRVRLVCCCLAFLFLLFLTSARRNQEESTQRPTLSSQYHHHHFLTTSFFSLSTRSLHGSFSFHLLDLCFIPALELLASSTTMSSHRPRKATANAASASPKRTSVLLSALIVGFCALIAALDSIRSNFYIFDHKQIHKVASTAVANHPGNATAIFDEILDHLRADPKTAPYINKNHFSVESEWMFNNAGGAMGSMYIIHASITEYLIFFGTPVGTEGHTGRHTVSFHTSPGMMKRGFHILTHVLFGLRRDRLMTTSTSSLVASMLSLLVHSRLSTTLLVRYTTFAEDWSSSI